MCGGASRVRSRQGAGNERAARPGGGGHLSQVTRQHRSAGAGVRCLAPLLGFSSCCCSDTCLSRVAQMVCRALPNAHWPRHQGGMAGVCDGEEWCAMQACCARHANAMQTHLLTTLPPKGPLYTCPCHACGMAQCCVHACCKQHTALARTHCTHCCAACVTSHWDRRDGHG